MKTHKKTYVIDLGDGIKAKYSIERKGQQHPSEGDGIVVEAQINLPAEDGRLDPRLQFGNRLKLCDFPLDMNWGVAIEEGFRCWRKHFIATTWAQAFADGEAWARAKLQKLADALAIRAQALQNAEG